jgi:hypothetical protein
MGLTRLPSVSGLKIAWMSAQRRRPSRRKERNPSARWLVTGLTAATAILHNGRTAHIQPVRSGDHRSRYSTGQRLALKPYVPGPTDANLIITSVQGPREQFHLADVDYQTARDLGYVRLDDFQIAWVLEHDQDWLDRQDAPTNDTILARFQHRWAGKLAWLLRFRIDPTAAPRLLAARSDELYVQNEAMALKGEMPALYEDQWKLHVGPQSRYREQDRLAVRRAEREAKTAQDRLLEAKRAAKAKGADIRDECRRFERLTEQGKTDKAMRQLALIEARTFPAAA